MNGYVAPAMRALMKLPNDPVELRAFVERLASLFRGWANSKSYDDACQFMTQIREMTGANEKAVSDYDEAQGPSDPGGHQGKDGGAPAAGANR